jgi:putative ABC transport system permease protein
MRQKMDYVTFIVAGIRNKPGRNLATIFCFAFIAANIFSGQFLIAGAAGGVERGVTRMGADHLVVPSQYMVFLRGAGPNNTIAIVMAEPSNYRMKATIMQKPLTDPLKPGEVIVGHEITGDGATRISVGGQSYRIAGRLDPTQSSIDRTIFLRLDDAYALAATKGIVPLSAPRIGPGEVNAVLIRDSNREDRDVVGTRIKRVFTSSPDYKYVSVIGRHFSLDPVSEDIQAIPGLLSVISAFVVIIALPLIALIAAMVAHERQREIGLLKAMGAKRNTVFFLVIAESLVLAAIGGISGVCVSISALFLMNTQGILNSALQVSFRMPPLMEIGSMAGLALLVVMVIGSVASLWPAYQSSMMNPYDAIRNEG